MPTIAHVSNPVSLAATTGALFGSMGLHVKQLIRAYRHRRDAEKLASLDDRMLADIGLTRGDLRDAFAEPLCELRRVLDDTGVLQVLDE